MNRDDVPASELNPACHKSAAAAHGEQRISTLVGDRLCVSCGYNLIGQSVLREPHYQLLIVRCPECGTVAALQEYPLLGRWANRWAALLAALWMAVMIAIVMGGGLVMYGFSMGTAHEASQTYSNFISQKYQQHAQQLMTQGLPATYSPSEMQAWRDAQNFDLLFKEAGGWKSGVNWAALLIWVPGSFCAFVIGSVIAIAVMMNHRRMRVFAALLVIGVAATFATFTYLNWQQQNVGWYWNDSLKRIGPPILALSLTQASIAFLAGVWLGRRAVRGLLRILLPPRLLQALSMLWIVDGLQPPPIPKPNP